MQNNTRLSVPPLVWVRGTCIAALPSVRSILVLLAGGACAVVGLLPDVFEPAIHPNHRSILHSYMCAGLLSYGTKWVWENPTLDRDQKMHWSVCVLGYLSHLIADGQTPKGLPLIRLMGDN